MNTNTPLKATEYNENTLLQIGFKKQYIKRKDGFYFLDVNDKFYFTIGYKEMILSIHLKGYGHIQRLPNIKTIEGIQTLFHSLTNTELTIK